MYGNQYTYAGTAYTCAYAVMQIPSTLIIQKVRPSYWLGLMEIGWGTFTFAQAGMHSASELYAFRFLVGLFENSFFPCMLFILGSWYTKTELAKRIALFHMTAPLGTAFSGYLQAAVYTNLNGVHGLAGWRWLYIICGVMTVPVGIATIIFLPDTPHTTRAWFLTADECVLSLERVKKAGKAPPVPITWAKARRIFTRWRWYALVLGYILYGTSCAASGYFAIWLKSEHFSVALRNVIPSGASLISASCVVLWGFGADYTGSRFAFVLGPLIYGLIPNCILAVWPKSVKLKEYAFLTTGVQLMTAVFYAWANEICAGDSEERAIVLSSMNGLQYASNFKYEIGRGFHATFGFVIEALLAILLIQFLHKRELKQKKVAELRDSETADSEEDSSYGNKNKEKVDVAEANNFQELASAGAVIS
ncbi:MFS general substrate transporter [Stipitochalara longipes BDJ]|nr:MFS general substrate transporter [Stipitochalara longipes BDJ]